MGLINGGGMLAVGGRRRRRCHQCDEQGSTHYRGGGICHVLVTKANRRLVLRRRCRIRHRRRCLHRCLRHRRHRRRRWRRRLCRRRLREVECRLRLPVRVVFSRRACFDWRTMVSSRSSRKSSDALSSKASCSGYALENIVSNRSPEILGLSSGNIFKLSNSS